jgi:hypothetical protein
VDVTVVNPAPGGGASAAFSFAIDGTISGNASAFASWLGLCPENKISGGKVLYTKSRRVRSRVATALRMAANSLHHAKDYLGEFFRRITRKLGKPQAITAAAHKLARIVYHLLSTREAYNESVFHRCDEDPETGTRSRIASNDTAPHQNGPDYARIA